MSTIVGKGDRKSQQRRRRRNNREVPHQMYDFILIDGNISDQPYAYCCHYNGYLTRNQTICHRCVSRECPQYKSFEWAIERGKL